MAQKKVAIVLSGCGVFDGSEIREAVLALLAVEKAGALASFFAPNIEQTSNINHLSKSPDAGSRNVLVESARIARGEIEDLKNFSSNNFDALIFPGGFGAAKNLSSFAYDGANCTVLESVKSAILAMFETKKPLGFICIAPVIAAKVLGQFGVSLTIGNDKSTALALESFGAKHINCDVKNFVKDSKYKVYSTPAYMLEASMPDLEIGISKMISAILSDNA